MLGAITLGITIHFFLISRKSLKDVTSDANGKVHRELEVWKLKYFNDTELRDKELEDLRYKLSVASTSTDDVSIEIEELQIKNKKLQTELESLRKGGAVSGGQEIAELQRRLMEAEENYEIYSIEADEQRAQNKKLQAEIESLKKNSGTPREHREPDQGKKKIQEAEESARLHAAEAEDLRIVNKKLMAEIELLRAASAHPAPVAGEKPDYMEQLRKAQSSLMEHNEKINQLLGQIDIVKETEEKQQEILKINEELSGQVDELKFMLSQKEKEINNTRQKEHLTNEMTSMIDSAYNEFNVLQDKIQKLESQVNTSKRLNIEYEDLKESHYRISQDFEEQKRKYSAAITENKQLLEELTETEDKLKEANFQRQQLQKRVAYLEELNNDMQAVADANKKLEHQLKRIGELESMLNMIAGERDELARKQFNG